MASTSEWVQHGLLAVLITVACYTDLTTQKIKNWLTLPMIGVGSLGAFWMLGVWWAGVLGVVVTLGVCYFPWRLNAIKAGDVKLLMAVGALFGPELGALATLWTLTLGVPAGLLVLAIKGRLGNIKAVLIDKTAVEPTVVAHAPVVALGIVVALWGRWPDLW